MLTPIVLGQSKQFNSSTFDSSVRYRLWIQPIAVHHLTMGGERMQFSLRAWILVVILAAATATGVVRAEAQYKIGDQVPLSFKVAPRDGEFRNGSAPGITSIACTTVSPPGTPPPTEFNYNNCLRFGALHLGMEFYKLQIALSDLKAIPEQFIINPRLVNKTPEGISTLMIPVATTRAGEQIRMQSYLVVVMDSEGIVRSLQLTGLPGDIQNKLQFSSIALGAAQQNVTDILGLPSSVSDVPEIGGKMWSYFPFPFTIEFKDGAVYSVRIHEPSKENYSKAFVPLKVVPN